LPGRRTAARTPSSVDLRPRELALAGAIAALTGFALGRMRARHAGEESVTEPLGDRAARRRCRYQTLAVDESSAH
jgi:hypothetical protein